MVRALRSCSRSRRGRQRRKGGTSTFRPRRPAAPAASWARRKRYTAERRRAPSRTTSPGSTGRDRAPASGGRDRTASLVSCVVSSSGAGGPAAAPARACRPGRGRRRRTLASARRRRARHRAASASSPRPQHDAGLSSSRAPAVRRTASPSRRRRQHLHGFLQNVDLVPRSVVRRRARGGRRCSGRGATIETRLRRAAAPRRHRCAVPAKTFSKMANGMARGWYVRRTAGASSRAKIRPRRPERWHAENPLSDAGSTGRLQRQPKPSARR